MKTTTSVAINCISCNREIQEALYNSSFLPNLFKLLIGFIVIGIIVVALAYFSFKKYKRHTLLSSDKNLLNPVPLSTTSIILGIGIGGFFDGIFLHQVLQWHGMLTNRISPDTVVGKSVNMFWDGIFHLFTLTAVVIGIISLIRLLKRANINPSSKLAWGGFFAGWGIFNLVEGIIHHHILKLHNVKELSKNQDLWNYAFLASGIIFIAIGFTLIYNRSHYVTQLEKT